MPALPRNALDVSQISWRTCVAHLPTEDKLGWLLWSRCVLVVSGARQLQQVHAVMGAHGCGGGLAEGVQDADGVGLIHEAGHFCLGGPAEV